MSSAKITVFLPITARKHHFYTRKLRFLPHQEHSVPQTNSTTGKHHHVVGCGKAGSVCQLFRTRMTRKARMFLASCKSIALILRGGRKMKAKLGDWTISPHLQKLGKNRAVGTSRNRCGAYRRHLCRRCGAPRDLIAVLIVHNSFLNSLGIIPSMRLKNFTKYEGSSSPSA